MENTATQTIAQTLKVMMDMYEKRDEDERYVFVDGNGNPNKYARSLGEELYRLGGISAMDKVMKKLQQHVQARMDQGEEWYIFDLRQLEWCWNGIGPWMA